MVCCLFFLNMYTERGSLRSVGDHLCDDIEYVRIAFWYLLQILKFQCLMQSQQVRVTRYPPERHVMLWSEDRNTP